MARFVLFANSLCFDTQQQVLYPMQQPAQRVVLTPLQTAVLYRVLNAGGQLVRNQALHTLFQRVPDEVPFADRLTATIAEINQLAARAQAPGPLVLQVPLIGCVLAGQADVVRLNEAPAVSAAPVNMPEVPAASTAPVNVPEPSAVSTAPVAALPAGTPRRRWPLRAMLIALLCANAALALVARHFFAPAQGDALAYTPYLREGSTQFFIGRDLTPDSFIVQNALRRYHHWQPRLPDGSPAQFVYINPGRTQLFSSAFLCAKPIAQKDNQCLAWSVTAGESPDA
ncbi:hypothetical protein [Candidatus Pantoea soli]|uniref:Uncharacterized protein n=1 Tax=Candidatus Pantoea soli TaxID=3098669 RepID=A0A518XGK4_9GAMM|nr:hypothetical protein [Pantoea soli]QDY43333.1 hypothetical protein D8B20_16250 [Pantoea soli]